MTGRLNKIQQSTILIPSKTINMDKNWLGAFSNMLQHAQLCLISIPSDTNTIIKMLFSVFFYFLIFSKLFQKRPFSSELEPKKTLKPWSKYLPITNCSLPIYTWVLTKKSMSAVIFLHISCTGTYCMYMLHAYEPCDNLVQINIIITISLLLILFSGIDGIVNDSHYHK